MRFIQSFIIFSCLFVSTCFSQQKKISKDIQISLLTCGSSNELHSLFGHTALRFKDSSQNIDLVFNYGMFDFDTPNFYGKFIKGDLLYQLDWNYYTDFFFHYSRSNRTITEQTLSLSFQEKQKIWQGIWQEFNSDKRYYTYKFIHNNCTSKATDLLNNHTRYTLETDFDENNKTYRQIINKYLDKQYFSKVGINLVLGSKIDKKCELIFIPEHLEKSIQLTDSLQEKKKTLFKAISNTKFDGQLYIFYGMFILLVFFSNSRIIQKIYSAIFFVLISICIFFQVYSNHQEVLSNSSILVFNFLILFIHSKCKKWIIVLSLFLTVLGVVTSSFEYLKVMLPLIILHLIMIFQMQKPKPIHV